MHRFACTPARKWPGQAALGDLRLEIIEIGCSLLDVDHQCWPRARSSGESSSQSALVLAELLDAEVLVLDLIGLLLSQGCDHVGNGLASSPRRSRPKAEAL